MKETAPLFEDGQQFKRVRMSPASDPQPNYQQPQSYKYDYDPKKIHYTQMSVDQWANVPNDPSPYYQYWNGPRAFQPNTFANNRKARKTWNDMLFTILFWINFAVSFGVLAFLALKPKEFESRSSPISHNNGIAHPLLLGMAIGIALNVVHFLYLMRATFYIKYGILMGLLCSIPPCISSGIILRSFLTAVVFFINVIMAVFLWRHYRRYFEVTAAVLKHVCNMIIKYPSIILLFVGLTVVETALTIAYGFFFVNIFEKDMPIALYYGMFSYFWITLTFSYVAYMTAAGLSATWYFLNGTEHFPRHPLWESFKRAATSSFGSAAFAGLLLALINVLEQIVENKSNRKADKDDKDDDDDKRSKNELVFMLIRCVALCMLRVLKNLAMNMNRYGLIYCATFGVPYREGCRRWTEISFWRYVDVITSGCVITKATFFNIAVFGLLSMGIGHFVSYILGYDEFKTVLTIGSAVLTLIVLFTILIRPINAMADTLFVCFSENPERLKTTAAELAKTVNDMYETGLNNRINNNNH